MLKFLGARIFPALRQSPHRGVALIVEPGVNQRAADFSRIISGAMAPHGTSKAYIVQRLRDQGETALLAAVETGKITALTAAVELGWVLRPPKRGGNIQRTKRIAHQVRVTGEGLSPAQVMELTYGPSPAMGSYFGSREELADAWQQARERLLERSNPGRRPAAFYEFEWDGSRPSYDTERSVLWRMGLLSAGEKDVLETEWKVAFTEAQEVAFTVNDGTGILKGDCARIAHYRWADIPNTLVKRWTAAARRRRAGQPVVPLEEAAAK